MLSVKTTDAKESLTELINQVIHNRKRIVLTRRV